MEVNTEGTLHSGKYIVGKPHSLYEKHNILLTSLCQDNHIADWLETSPMPANFTYEGKDYIRIGTWHHVTNHREFDNSHFDETFYHAQRMTRIERQRKEMNLDSLRQVVTKANNRMRTAVKVMLQQEPLQPDEYGLKGIMILLVNVEEDKA